jgi:hypothetical protein
LAPDIQAAYDRDGNNIDFPVKAGQLVGRIGGQTLDFAVWDTDKPLTGFVVPEHYKVESWKLYTVDPLEYYTDDIKTQALAKYLRTPEPRSGKIDYDIDGKLQGNWFQIGTDGYGGTTGGTGGEYWKSHLAIAPEHLDPTRFVISIGNWQPEASQFTTKTNSPDPATVDVGTGLVKYDLTQINYRTGGTYWDRVSLPSSPITVEPGPSVLGCFLVQMTGDRELKAEVFKNTSCNSITEFTAAAVQYTR